MVAPLLMALLLGTVLYGYVLLVHHGVQQLAAEAARSAVAGLSDAERDALARNFVRDNAAAYGILDPSQLQVSSEIGPPPSAVIRISLSYDMTRSAVYRLSSLIPLPSPIVRRSAAVQRGGY
ncbi:pilus assembly protein [Enterovirga sp. DB1703]|uniref:Pilus assembly protein n=2 Tax=Enterovirga aerilata TaxID=2730920 RepID=A0A849I907_9HYPH|nr:pilus assembly protein [Enterovirga sp. DB1703]